MGARYLRLAAILAAGLAVAPLLPTTVEAAVVSASSTPARISIAPTGPATVGITWRLVRSGVNIPHPGTVSSNAVRVFIGSELAATLAQPLSRDVKGLAATETVTLRETLQIPSSLVYRAVKQHAGLRLVRRFADSIDDISASAELLVTPSGPASAALSVERLALAFDNGLLSRTVAQGSELRVVAVLGTGGVGLLSGQWEVATGATVAGTPVFQPFALVRQGVAGGGQTVITSPPLPTAQVGISRVRFRIVDPALAIDTPTLQYYVTPSTPETVTPQTREIAVASPRAGDTLSAETHFAWTPLTGAQAYKIVFYAMPAEEKATAAQGAPLAGLVVPGGSHEASLEAHTLRQLPGGRSYLWKVIAIDDNGAIIGSSAAREIHRP